MRNFINLVEARAARSRKDVAARLFCRQLQTKESLEAFFGDEDNYPGYTRDGEHLLGAHGPSFSCDSWAAFVASVFPKGRVKIMGFSARVNPVPILSDYDGHTFAILDNRYIIDGWIKNVEAFSDRAVFDLNDPADAPAIEKFYGIRTKWSEPPG